MPIDSLLKKVSTNSALSGALGGAAGGALVSAFANKKSARKLLKTGGLVALGGAAWHAYQKYQQRETSGATDSQAPVMDQESFVAHATTDASVPLILSAMVAAGHADGHLDELERKRIWRKALDAQLPAQALTELQQMLESPLSLESLAAQAGDLQTRIEVYTASRLALDADCAQGASYLERLAQALELPPGLVTALNEQD